MKKNGNTNSWRVIRNEKLENQKPAYAKKQASAGKPGTRLRSNYAPTSLQLRYKAATLDK